MLLLLLLVVVLMMRNIPQRPQRPQRPVLLLLVQKLPKQIWITREDQSRPPPHSQPPRIINTSTQQCPIHHKYIYINIPTVTSTHDPSAPSTLVAVLSPPPQYALTSLRSIGACCCSIPPDLVRAHRIYVQYESVEDHGDSVLYMEENSADDEDDFYSREFWL